jgi:hypothetical protein
LGVEKPRPASDKVYEADYTFERPVEFNDCEGKISTNFIDLYKRHCFVLEAKQGADKALITEAEILGADRAKVATELPDWPNNLAEQAQAVQWVIQQFSHPISAADISRQFAEAKKAANVAREQQIGHILETIITLGLLSAAMSLPKGKTGEGYVR